MYLKAKLIIAGLSLMAAGYVGHWVTKNYYQAKHTNALEKAISKAEKKHKEDLALAKSRIKARTIIKYRTKTIIKKVKDANFKSCPKLPADYVRLRNEALGY